MHTAPGAASTWRARCRAVRFCTHLVAPFFYVNSLLGAKERNVLGPEPLPTSIQTWLSRAPGRALRYPKATSRLLQTPQNQRCQQAGAQKGVASCSPGPGASRRHQATPRRCGRLATSAQQSGWSLPTGQSPGGHQVLTPALPSVCGCARKPGRLLQRSSEAQRSSGPGTGLQPRCQPRWRHRRHRCCFNLQLCGAASRPPPALRTASHSHTHTATHRLTPAHSLPRISSRLHTHCHAPAHARTHCHAPAHTHTHTATHQLTLTHTHIATQLTLAHAHCHTSAHTHTATRQLTHTHTATQLTRAPTGASSWSS